MSFSDPGPSTETSDEPQLRRSWTSTRWPAAAIRFARDSTPSIARRPPGDSATQAP